ncbi:hypothetical protein E6O75_ATG00626 [Venturia nashicola]|uniref:Uncharacterized protein n=1 Tax=Venturia nashicola TaxID=86259 RepID=A0A4Z1PNU3_9PEZI|nr:hypothetical protein E6O75_ATG00626 [Venturia nashicola]
MSNTSATSRDATVILRALSVEITSGNMPWESTKKSSAPSLSADSQYLPPQSSLSAGALGKRKRDDETSILGTPNSKLAKQLFTEREIAQTLMHEMSAMRDRFQREREERDKQDRLVRDELEELRDKYFELLRAGSS